MKLHDAIREYVNYIKLEAGLSPGTVVSRDTKLRHFARWLSDIGYTSPNIKDIQLSHIRQYVVSLGDRDIKASTLRTYLESLRSLYNYLLEYGYVDSSPAHRVRMPKKNAPERQLITTDEIVRMFGAIDLIRPQRRAVMAGAMLSILVYAGLRSAELRALAVNDIVIDGEDMDVVVKHGKCDKRRVVPMHMDGIPYVRDWLGIRVIYLEPTPWAVGCNSSL